MMWYRNYSLIYVEYRVDNNNINHVQADVGGISTDLTKSGFLGDCRRNFRMAMAFPFKFIMPPIIPPPIDFTDP